MSRVFSPYVTFPTQFIGKLGEIQFPFTSHPSHKIPFSALRFKQG